MARGFDNGKNGVFIINRHYSSDVIKNILEADRRGIKSIVIDANNKLEAPSARAEISRILKSGRSITVQNKAKYK